MPDRLTETERLLTAFRPTAPVDPAWADTEVQRIMDAPQATPRRWRWVAGIAATGVVAVGGTAYAAGLVPQVIMERLGSGDGSYALNRIGEVREVFDFYSQDGTHIQFFMADNAAGGQCWTATHNLTPDTDPADLAYTCAAGPVDGFTPAEDNGVSVLPTDSDHSGDPILFGLSLADFEAPPGTRQVRILGPGFDRIIAARRAEGWAVEIPASSEPAIYTVQYQDANGRVLATTKQWVEPPPPESP